TLDGVENKYVYITSTKNYGKEWVFSDIKMPIKSPLNQLPITIIGKDNNLGYGDYEDTLKIIILKKDLNWLEKMFIKGSILRTQEAAQLKNPEIKIKIVNNSENTLNKTINNSLNIFMNASSQ
ncbi:hypothetical protein K9M18_01380, partial [Candidatus Woesearchaeota archaeon]|nr:hypothetical protein [Candidatus Woesearchaeota archaeon]